MVAKKSSSKRGSGKRELIDTGRDKRYIQRDEKGRFDEVVDVGRSLSQDRKRQAKKQVKPGYGNQGDLAPRTSSSAKKSTKRSSKKR
jgi:hypothetical protein